MKVLKRVSLFLFSLIFAFNSVAVSAAALEEESLTLSEYTASLTDMIQDYSFGAAGTNSGTSSYPSNRLLVKTGDNNPLENDCGAVAKIEGYDCLHIMQYSSANKAAMAYEYYSGLSSVEYVEYDFCFTCGDIATEITEETENNYHLSWGSNDVKTDEAMSVVSESAPEVVVAVLDTGIDSTHSFFEGRFEDSGVNLVDENSDTSDDHDHGTHVAGIVVDNTPSNVKVKPYKVMDSEGVGFYSIICAGIKEAIDDEVDVINMSLGEEWGEEEHQSYSEAIELAVQNNISVIVSAGNDASNASDYCPADNEDVITVAASDYSSKPWENSNYGSCVDIAAPGVLIFSTLPGEKHGFGDGTSMAAPFVSAAAAIMKSLNKSVSPKVIKDAIVSTARVPDGWDSRYGAGILNMDGMVSTLRLPTPKMSFDSNQNVVIESTVQDAVIYYTTDGKTPVVGKSAVYTGPINPGSAANIKAVACKDGSLPSKVINLKIKWSEDITVRYMGTADLPISAGAVVESAYSSHDEIVAYNNKQIKGLSIGEATVTLNLATGQRVTYNVTVEFASWQWLHKIVYQLFGILLWSF